MAFVPHILPSASKQFSKAPLRQQLVMRHGTPSTTPTLSRRAALLSLLTFPLPAFADHTYVAAKRAYDRYYPRIEAGVATVREMGATVKNGGSVKDVVGTRLFDVGFRRALSIYATSFSDNYLGERSKELLKCVNTFYKEINRVEGEESVEHFNKAVEALVGYFEIARLDQTVVDGLYI